MAGLVRIMCIYTTRQKFVYIHRIVVYTSHVKSLYTFAENKNIAAFQIFISSEL